MEELLPISPIKDVTFRNKIIHAFRINKITLSWMNEGIYIVIRTDAKPNVWAFILGVNCKSAQGTSEEVAWGVHVHNLTNNPFGIGLKLYQTNTDNSFDFYVKCEDAALYYMTVQKIGLNPTYNEGTGNKSSELVIYGTSVNSLPESANEITIGG